MQKQQAAGLDTRAMLPVYGGIYVILCEWLFPWISMPVLKYSKLPTAYTFRNLEDCYANIQACVTGGGMLKMSVFTSKELKILLRVSTILKGCAFLVAALLFTGCICVFVKKKKSVPYVRLCFLVSACMAAAAFLLVGAGNLFLNHRMGRANHFMNLTLHSYIQMSPWMYGQLIISVLLVLFAGKLLDTDAEYQHQMYIDRTKKKDTKIGKRTKTALLLILIAIPLVIFIGIFFLNDRSSTFIGLCIIGLAMIPFGMVFEYRRPQAREILLISVMAAIAVVGRMAFFMVPQFKPVSAVVIIAGVSLGAEAGFLTGAVAGFVSNFFFGQGPWTPWQMFAFGIIGFLAGILFSKKKKPDTRRKEQLHRVALCVYGGFATLIIYGFLMDTASVGLFSGEFSWAVFLSYYVTGFPFNVIHGVSTMIFLFFLAVPMEKKLDRIKKKYGILEV